MKVLIVEDNAVNARIVELQLRKHNFQTLVAHDGVEGLQRLADAPDIQLVVADIMMPHMDGLELLRRMKDHKDWCDIPVIMCTALGQSETVSQALALGCQHYVLKPINTAEFIDRVHEVLEAEMRILREPEIVMRDEGLDAEAYAEATAAFASTVRVAISEVAEMIASDARSALRPPSLSPLAEGAAVLGAERVKHALEELPMPQDGTAPEEELRAYRALWLELNRVQRALAYEFDAAA